MSDYYFKLGADIHHARVEPVDNGYIIRIGANVYDVQASRRADGQVALTIDGARYRTFVAAHRDSSGNSYVVWLDGQTYRLERVDPRQSRQPSYSQQAGVVLNATMPGQVRAVLAAQGDCIAAGAPLVILEAMKMEIRISAPADARVASIACAVGDVVERGQPLVRLDYSAVQEE